MPDCSPLRGSSGVESAGRVPQALGPQTPHYQVHHRRIKYLYQVNCIIHSHYVSWVQRLSRQERESYALD